MYVLATKREDTKNKQTNDASSNHTNENYILKTLLKLKSQTQMLDSSCLCTLNVYLLDICNSLDLHCLMLPPLPGPLTYQYSQ